MSIAAHSGTDTGKARLPMQQRTLAANGSRELDKKYEFVSKFPAEREIGTFLSKFSSILIN